MCFGVTAKPAQSWTWQTKIISNCWPSSQQLSSQKAGPERRIRHSFEQRLLFPYFFFFSGQSCPGGRDPTEPIPGRSQAAHAALPVCTVEVRVRSCPWHRWVCAWAEWTSTGAQLTKEFQVRKSLEGDRLGALAAAHNLLSFPSCRSDFNFCLEGITATPSCFHITSYYSCLALRLSGGQVCATKQYSGSPSLLKDRERWLQKAIKITAKR